MDYQVLALGVAVGIVVALVVSSGSRRRVRRVERKLDTVIAHLGIVPTVPVPQPGTVVQPLSPMQPGLDQVYAFLRQGQKIQAIKAYREFTGSDLKTAKEAVEQISGER